MPDTGQRNAEERLRWRVAGAQWAELAVAALDHIAPVDVEHVASRARRLQDNAAPRRSTVVETYVLTATCDDVVSKATQHVLETYSDGLRTGYGMAPGNLETSATAPEARRDAVVGAARSRPARAFGRHYPGVSAPATIAGGGLNE